MWLLNTKTLRLHFFHGVSQTYAILSHRWEENEALFRHLSDADMIGDELVEIEDNDIVRQMREHHRRRLRSISGWTKVLSFCQKARELGYDYAWIDTCCIDKSSSAELQEAINSMYLWYMRAGICIVYLNDVEKEQKSFPETQFRASKWFHRGWTLQELLAPRESIFLDCKWNTIGNGEDLADRISDITNISRFALAPRTARTYILSAPVAEKMFWVSTRETTRVEDMAYCLLGLFNVNMPLLYGEGSSRAFRRLQLEIIKASSDETIFVFNNALAQYGNMPYDLLATIPGEFKDVRLCKLAQIDLDSTRRPAYEMTNKGLRIEMLLFKYRFSDFGYPLGDPPRDAQDRLYVAPLRCSLGKSDKVIFIGLLRIEGDADCFSRYGKWFEAPFDWTDQAVKLKSKHSQLITVRKPTMERVWASERQGFLDDH